MTEGFEKEQLLPFVGGTGMEDSGVVGILELENFEWQKEQWSWICERTRLKWVTIKTGFLNHSITRIWKCGRNTKIRNRHT